MSHGARSFRYRALCLECGIRPPMVLMTTIRHRFQKVVQVVKPVRMKDHSLCLQCYRALQNSMQGRD